MSSGTSRRTVDGAFEEFLGAQINIARGIRSNASVSQQNIRKKLNDEADQDDGFPIILDYADSDFIGGSFGRHVKNKPLDDIDIYFPIDGADLVYSEWGVASTDYVVASDGGISVNPLLSDPERWMDGNSISSRKLIDEFAKSLRGHYPTTTRVRRAGEAVNVKLANGLGFDVVPCFLILPKWRYLNHREFYLIPDGYDRWIRTNPKIDKEWSDELHGDNNKTLRKAVKLLKWYNTKFLGGRIASYYIELAIMRSFREMNNVGDKIFRISTAVTRSFHAIKTAIDLGALEPLIPNAPQVEYGDITQSDIDELALSAQLCDLARTYEQNGDIAEALDIWKDVFGDQFPT